MLSCKGYSTEEYKGLRMARVSITEAARLAGVSRNSFYKSYLQKGVISVSKDSSGKKFIDTSEVLRVFGELQGDDKLQGGSKGDSSPLPPITPEETAKDVEIRLLREQLSKSEDREHWLQSRVDALSSTLKLLEHKPEPAKVTRHWWQVLWK